MGSEWIYYLVFAIAATGIKLVASGLGFGGRPFAEDIDADVEDVERNGGGDGGVDREGNAGEVD